MRKLLTLLLLFAAFHSQAQINDSAILGTDQYLMFLNHGAPYPRVKQVYTSKINTAGYKNVMNYGAAGNGTTPDDAAILACFNDAEKNNSGGVIFPKGKTFLVTKLQTVNLTHDLNIYAYGSTIKMAVRKRYSFLQITYPNNSTKHCVWLGGTLDANQYNQTWPGNPHGGIYDSAFSEAHGRFIGITNAGFAMFKDVIVLNTVVDGAVIEDTKIGVFDHDSASGGAPFGYDDVGEQGTYFKVRQNTIGKVKWGYWLNISATGGGIVDHFSYPTNQPLDTNTTSVHMYVNCWNQHQDGIHIEDCWKNFFFKCIIGCDTNAFYRSRMWLTNRSGSVTSIDGCIFNNAYVTFNNAPTLRLGIIKNCTFTSQRTDNFLQFFAYNATQIFNCTFDGKPTDEQVQCNNVKNSSFFNFGNKKAIINAFLVDSCAFKTGTTQPISFITINGVGGKGYGNTFSGCPTNTNSTPTTGYLNIFKSKIYFKNDLNHPIGAITGGL